MRRKLFGLNIKLLVEVKYSNQLSDDIKTIIRKGESRCLFDKKRFVFGDTVKYFSPILNLFECVTNFETRTVEEIHFKCLICSENHNVFYAKLG